MNLSGSLKADIDISGYTKDVAAPKNFRIIGNKKNPYKGTFNGENHSISNLVIEETNLGDVGMFGDISGATIQNLVLRSPQILGRNNVGFIFFCNIISSCRNIFFIYTFLTKAFFSN